MSFRSDPSIGHSPLEKGDQIGILFDGGPSDHDTISGLPSVFDWYISRIIVMQGCSVLTLVYLSLDFAERRSGFAFYTIGGQNYIGLNPFGFGGILTLRLEPRSRQIVLADELS